MLIILISSVWIQVIWQIIHIRVQAVTAAIIKTELQTMFNSYKSIIAEKNVPIVMGEFSASDFNNTESRINWAKDYLSMAKDGRYSMRTLG